MSTTQENENQTFCSPMSSPKSTGHPAITYTDTEIDKLGLKFTMDGGADGHDTNAPPHGASHFLDVCMPFGVSMLVFVNTTKRAM